MVRGSPTTGVKKKKSAGDKSLKGLPCRPAAGAQKKKPATGSWTYLLGALLIGVPSPACNFQCFGGVLAALPIKLETDNNTVRQQETHGTSQRSSNEIPQAWLNNVHDVAKQSFPHRPLKVAVSQPLGFINPGVYKPNHGKGTRNRILAQSHRPRRMSRPGFLTFRFRTCLIIFFLGLKAWIYLLGGFINRRWRLY